MRRVVALAAAAALLAAVPVAEAAKPLRFAAGKRPACAAAKKKQRTVCRKRTRARGWKARRVVPAAREGVPAGEGAPGGDTPPSAVPAGDTPLSAVPAGVTPPADEVAPPVAEEPPAEPLCDPSPWLGAIAEDVDGFRLRLTRTCVPEGTVLFQFRNEDLAFHNLWAQGTAPVRAAREVVGDTPGETMVTASEQLAAGEWRLYCSLPGHEAMTRPVTVTPVG